MSSWRTRLSGMGVLIAFVVVIIFGVAVKNWQCSEMFPDADRLACILWK